jgi:hypothetical protein
VCVQRKREREREREKKQRENNDFFLICEKKRTPAKIKDKKNKKMPWDQGPGLRCPGALVPGIPSKTGTGPVFRVPGPVIVGPPKNPCPGWSHDFPDPKTPSDPDEDGWEEVSCEEPQLGWWYYRDGRDSRFADTGGIAERVAFCRYN